MSDFDPPPFPRGKLKIRRVHPSADGTIERSPVATPDGWWESVLNDQRVSGKPLDYDTLWYNRDDTAALSCDECKLSKAVTITELLSRPENARATKVSDAIVNYVNCPRRAKRCRVGFRLRNARRD